MTKTAFLFPGQGAQYVGMGKDLYENSPAAKKVFEEADVVLGFPLSVLCFEGPIQGLTRTENCQPAVLTASVAALEALKEAQPRLIPSYVAGLSLGEYSALVACGVIGFPEAVSLVRKRGEFMEAAAERNPGGMSCVLGLERGVVEELCRETGCAIANLNCPGQIVISGARSSLEAAVQAAVAKGARRVVPLDVSGAFHCSLMSEAGARLKAEIEKIVFRAPRVPLISNVDAQAQTDPLVIKNNLIKQVHSVTYWEASMRYLLREGTEIFYEIGPGSVLKGLMKKIEPAALVVSAGKREEVLRTAG